MAPTLLGSVGIVGAAALVAIVLLVVALAFRWFARLPSGFTLSLACAFLIFGVFGVWMTGAWGYRAARAIVFDQIVLDLKNIGDILERQIQAELDEASLQLAHVAAELPADRLAQLRSAALTELLREVTHVNHRFVQLALTDGEGRPLAFVATAGPMHPMSRVGLAYCLEGNRYDSDPYLAETTHGEREHVVDLCVPVKAGDASATAGALYARFDVQDSLVDLLSSARFNQSGSATLVAANGRILADPKAERLGADVTAVDAARDALAGRSGFATATLGNTSRLVFYRPVRNPATINPHSWALLTQINASEAAAPLSALAREIAVGILVIAIIGVIGAWAVSWSISRPVSALVAFARQVQGGDLTGRVTVAGRDVLGRLAAALDDMVRGLRERDRVKEVFGRYVATQVSQKVLDGDLRLGGERRRVTILFSDIRGFTAMSEKMQPEEVVAFLNEYFSEMVEAVFEYGGMLDKFLGDGLMAVFGSTENEPDHASRAVQTALRMRALLAKLNGERARRGEGPVAIGIGIHTDEVIVGNIGSRRRLEYTVIGDGVNTSSRLQSMNKELGTTILISETTYAEVRDAFVCEPRQHLKLRGKSKELAAYEVISLAGAAAVVA